LSAIPLILASTPALESKSTVVGSPPHNRAAPFEFLKGHSLHHHKHADSNKSAAPRDKNLALRETLETSRGASAAAKARGARGGIVASPAVHRASGETMGFGPRDDFDVHRHVKSDGRTKELFEERLRLRHRREVAYAKHAQKLVGCSQVGISLVQLQSRILIDSDQRQGQ
jgi:hypothetical protein